MPRRGIKVAPAYLDQVRQALRRHGFPSQNALAVELGLSRATITSFFTGKAIDYGNFVEISERLGLDWQAIAYLEEDPPIKIFTPPHSPQELQKAAQQQMLKLPENRVGIDWRQVSQDMLKAQNQNRLTSNPLTAGDGLAFELDEIYVPLGLVERKQRDRHISDISPDLGSGVYELDSGNKVTRTFQFNEFFDQVLRLGESRRLAIIGEPGAGKTTLLQKIAAWVLENTSEVPIWISLADLQGKTLEQYLLSDWLKIATRKVSVTEAMQKDFGEFFNSGRVWLLLDGVDEMVTEIGNALAQIAQQLKGWVADARIVLTCRLNIWDAGNNALEAFDTYRNLDFSYGDAHTPDQVRQFIRHWFKDNLAFGERLRNELDRAGRERIKDAVKNPLRLALLCRTWALGQGRLPNTKAGFYQQFIEALYEWKQDRFPTSSTTRRKLNQVLGKLALQALTKAKTKFRLRHNFIESVLNNPDEDLFGLALQLGFLNPLGVAAEAEHQGERVYAFYHPTFQEYFAAQAILDWHYFLNHAPQNPAQGIYRIFEPEWKEVILLWLGREDIPKLQKEDFITALMDFQDRCGRRNFYGHRARFMAAACIAEYLDYGRADEIVAQMVKRGFGTYLEPGAGMARVALEETDQKRAIAALVQLIESTKNESNRRKAADSLGKIGTSNPTAIAALVQLVESTENEYTRWQAVDSLGKIASGNEVAIATLVQLVESTENEYTRWQASDSLGKIDPGNPTAIAVLMQLIESTENEYTRWQSAYSLGKIDPGNPIAVAALMRLIASDDEKSISNLLVNKLSKIDPDEPVFSEILSQIIDLENTGQIHQRADYTLGKVDPNNPITVAALVQLLESNQDEYVRQQVAYALGKTDPGNPIAIATLVQLLESTRNEYIRQQVAYSLGKIDPGNPTAIATLVQLIESTKNEYIRQQAAYSLGTIDPDNPIAIATLTQLLESSKYEYTPWQAAYRLGKIDSDNPMAIAALVQLLESTEDEYIRGQIAETLGEIITGNQTAIVALVQLLESTENENTRSQLAYSLGEIVTGNQTVIAALVQLLESTEDENTRSQLAYSLGEIDPGNITAIAALLKVIKSTKNEYIRWRAAEGLKRIMRDNYLSEIVTTLKGCLSDENYRNNFEKYRDCYEIIWYCAQNLKYPDFYQAWHHLSDNSHLEVLETIVVVDSTHITQCFNLAELARLLSATVASDTYLNENIELICIDGSKFIDPDNPAAKIYTEMVKHGCPKCNDGTPKTMPELQSYWDLLESDKHVVLVFYNPDGTASQGFSDAFLNALSKFDGAICVVAEQCLSHIPLKCFSQNQPQLVENIVGWMRAIALES